MFQLFVSKLPKSVPAAEVEEFLEKLFPEATHVQLLRGSHGGEHKGHAYAHFTDEAAVTDALQRINDAPSPTLHGALIHVKRASRLDTLEGNVVNPQPLPPQLANYSYSTCACVLSSLVDALDGVVDRCELSDGVTVVVFETEKQVASVVASCRGSATRCLPPLLPELLSGNGSRKRRRSDNSDDYGNDKDVVVSSVNVHNKSHAAISGADVVASYERRGFLPLAPAVALTLVRDFMEGRGRIAVKDQKGNMAVMNLPAHAAALE